MSQSPQYDFSTPQRQSTVAILLVVFKTLRVLFQTDCSALLSLLSWVKKSSDFGTYFVIFISGISLFRWFIHHQSFQELLLHIPWWIDRTLGYFGKEKLSIPLGKNPIHQLRTKSDPSFIQGQKLKLDTKGTEVKEWNWPPLTDRQSRSIGGLCWFTVVIPFRWL